MTLRYPVQHSTFVMAILFWLLTCLFGGRYFNNDTQKYLNPPPEFIEYFHFGFRESVSDSIWLRWIQDGDFCQTYLKPMEKVPVDQVEQIRPDSRNLNVNPRYQICENSWSFKMLDAVTRLAPKFKMPYMTGALMLAILVEDYEGATVLFDRGIKNYPDDWELLYRASYHFQYNLKDNVKAADLLNRAADHGGPIWMKSLAARLLSTGGQLELAIRTLVQYRDSIKDSVNAETLAKLDSRIEKLRSQMEK